MKFWRGSVHQLTSGGPAQLSLPVLQLPRERESIREVFRNLTDIHVVYHKRVWVASLEERQRYPSDDWFTFWLGHYRDQDGPVWRPPRGWGMDPQREQHAGQGFIHLPTKTLFLQSIAGVENPKVAFKMLERLLNKALTIHYQDASWVFELNPDVEANDFLRKLQQATYVVRFRVTMPVPNARSHKLLQELQGLGGEAFADHVDISLRARKGGIEKSSSFVKTACKLVVQGLASIKALVFYGKKKKGLKPSLLASDELTIVREHSVPELPELPRGQPAPSTAVEVLERSVGFLTDETHVEDVEIVERLLEPTSAEHVGTQSRAVRGRKQPPPLPKGGRRRGKRTSGSNNDDHQ